MVGALVYMHSRYSAARDIYEAQVDEDEDKERQEARGQPTSSSTGPKYSQVWKYLSHLFHCQKWTENKVFISRSLVFIFKV